MNLYRAVNTGISKLAYKIGAKAAEWDTYLYDKYMGFRKNLNKTKIGRYLKKNWDFDLTLWLDYAVRFDEQDAKSHIMAFFLFAVLAMHAVVKFVNGEDKFPEEFYLYLLCWLIFGLYEYTERLWLTKAEYYWIKQSSSDYKMLHNAYEILGSNYDQLRRQHTFIKKQSRYLQYLLESKGVKLTTYYFNPNKYCEEIAAVDKRINELKATLNWEKESGASKEKVASSVNPENANTPSSPSPSNPTVVADQVANSGVTAPNADSSTNTENANTPSSPSTSNPTVVADQVANSGVTAPNADADTESVEPVTESETAQLSAGCKTGELNGDELKAKLDEGEWELIN